MPKRPPSVQSAGSNPERLEPRLLRAVEANNVQDVREIIDQARSRQQCNEGFIAIGLVRACDKNLVEVARYLLTQNANPNFATGNKPPSLLRAAEYGHLEIAAALIEFGANLEVPDKKGRTPLMTAAYKGHFEIVQLLLTKSAKIGSVDHRHRNVLHNIAADRGDAGKGAKGGGRPRRKCGMDIVQYLLQAGIDVEAEDELGRTALHWTSVTDHEDLMRLLLKPRFHGGSPQAKVDARDKREKTPLHLAVSHKSEHLAKILLANGANVHARSDGDWTALHYACNKGSQYVVRCLLDAKADVNAELLTGRTPLHVAAEFGNIDAARLLADQPHCKRALKDRFGTTPLLLAAQHGNKDIAEMLAPWNHLRDLLNDEISASKQFDATIVDFGNFKNENRVRRRSVYDLLYARDPKDFISTLPRNVKSTNFRWIHLPANNITWCEALLTKRFIEEGAVDIEGYKALETSFNHQHRGQQHHSRFMRPMCQVVQRSSSAEEDASLVEMAGPPLMTLQEPHLLTAVPEIITRSPSTSQSDKAKERQKSTASAVGAGIEPEQTPKQQRPKPQKSPKSQIQRQETSLTTASESSNIGKQNGSPMTDKIRRQETTSTLAQSESSTLKQNKKAPQAPKSPRPKISKKDSRNSQSDKPPARVTSRSSCNIYMFMPYLHFETDSRREEMQSALEDPHKLCQLAGSARADEVLIRANLTKSASFLHVRRTLDQFFYHNIDTTTRDRDQVVYRFQKKHHTSNDPKIFMVDQLWMWVLGKDLIITSFPQRWRQPRNDPLNVLEGIIEDINSKTREPVQNVYELAMTISGRCFGTFDRHRKSDNDFQFLDMFEASIGAAMDGEASLFQDFSKASRQASEWLQTHQRPNRFSKTLEAETKAHEHAIKKQELYHFDETRDQEPQFIDKLLDVGQETDLLAEIKDIRDELDIIKMVLSHQVHLLPELKGAIANVYREERSPKQRHKLDRVFDEQEKTIGNPLKDINRMDNQASRIYGSIRDLLDLKQKHANAFEARFARDQAAGTQRQGQTIMVFTIVTVIFLPLSFIAAFFTIDIDVFPRNSSGNVSLDLGYVSSYIFGIGLAISIPCIAVALSVDEVGYGINLAKRRIRSMWWGWKRRRLDHTADPEHSLQTVHIEQTLSVAKSMRRSMDIAVGWNGEERRRRAASSRPPRRSAESPYEFAPRRPPAWEMERGRGMV